MDSIAHFSTRTWRIFEFQDDKFDKADIESQLALVEYAKAEQALVEAAKGNETLLQLAEDSQKSLNDTKTKLSEVETQEKSLKT